MAGWSAGGIIAAFAICAAGLAAAQQLPHTPGQIPPYVDPNHPPFQLPPGPSDPRERIYPGPVVPEPLPNRQTPVRSPYERSSDPFLGAGSQARVLPQGFTMTIDRSGLARTISALARPRQVGEQLAACWRPPAPGSEASLRIAFNRAGAVIGRPRVTYVRAGRGADRAAVARSIDQALARCLPLRFTRELGSAIAGRPFALRFIAPGAARP